MEATRENLEFLVVDFELISIGLKTSSYSLSLLDVGLQLYINVIARGGREFTHLTRTIYCSQNKVKIK